MNSGKPTGDISIRRGQGCGSHYVHLSNTSCVLKQLCLVIKVFPEKPLATGKNTLVNRSGQGRPINLGRQTASRRKTEEKPGQTRLLSSCKQLVWDKIILKATLGQGGHCLCKDSPNGGKTSNPNPHCPLNLEGIGSYSRKQTRCLLCV